MSKWQPGQSGNPGGRPALAKEFRARLSRFMVDEGGTEELLAIAGGKRDPKDQLRALQYIADHVYGKAPQVIAGADEGEGYTPLLLKFISQDISQDKDSECS
jgi:hypothetical protein